MELSHNRRGSGEPLVLVHGIGSQHQIWKPVLDALARERDVIAVDMPGFGDSPALEEDVVTPARQAEVLTAFLDGLGLDEVHAAGFSMGGAIALELGRLGRARTVTALSPVGFWSPREHTFSNLSLKVTRAVSGAMLPVAPVVLRTAVGRTAFATQQLARPWRMPAEEMIGATRNLATAPGWDAALAGLESWHFRDGGGIGCPVTIAWAQRDRLLLPRQANRARRMLPGARHVTLVGCGHTPTWDDPEQTARVLLAGSA